MPETVSVPVMTICYFQQDDPESHFFNDEVVGIEMGTEISHLSDTIDIHFKSVEKVKEMTEINNI